MVRIPFDNKHGMCITHKLFFVQLSKPFSEMCPRIDKKIKK